MVTLPESVPTPRRAEFTCNVTWAGVGSPDEVAVSQGTSVDTVNGTCPPTEVMLRI